MSGLRPQAFTPESGSCIISQKPKMTRPSRDQFQVRAQISLKLDSSLNCNEHETLDSAKKISGPIIHCFAPQSKTSPISLISGSIPCCSVGVGFSTIFSDVQKKKKKNPIGLANRAKNKPQNFFLFLCSI